MKRMYYDVEGHYVDRQSASSAVRPSKTWKRVWMPWAHKLKTEAEARRTMKNGLEIMDPASFTG
jgi:hypothetical protein